MLIGEVLYVVLCFVMVWCLLVGLCSCGVWLCFYFCYYNFLLTLILLLCVFLCFRINRADNGGIFSLPSSSVSRDRRGLTTIIHVFLTLCTLNMKMPGVEHYIVLSRVNRNP